MVRDAILSGAKGFIVKPFKEEGIIAAIKKLC
jgi:two-component system chemotaxis response regulator CheY